MARGRKSPKYLTHDEDKALVREALAGSDKAYNTLAQKYKPILYTAVRRRLGNSITEEEVEDMVMTVLGRAFISLHTYDSEKSKMFTWMIACVHNHMSSLKTKKKRIQTVDVVSERHRAILENATYADTTQGDVDRANLVKLVRALVDKLPPECSQVIKLKYFKELSNDEIADIMGIKPTDVWYRVNKAKRILKGLGVRNGLF
jgi:RNA polymerase sigma-70 factor (ECF subfamily)